MKSSSWATWRLLSADKVVEMVSKGGWLIHGPLNSDRDQYLPSRAEQRAQIEYIPNDELGDRITILVNGRVYDDPNPVACASSFVEEVVGSGQPAILDITSLAIPAIFILLQSFQDGCHDDLFASHVEPFVYNIRGGESLVPSYRLSDSYTGVRGIPGFFRPTRNDLTKTLYVMLGFEGHRFSAVVDYFNNDREVRPVLPLPSYRAGWHMLAVHGNLYTLDQCRTSRLLKRASAHNPFHLLAILENEFCESHKANQIAVAPIGTKPQALAAALFALRHNEVVIVCDHPTPRPSRSRGVACVRGYALSGLLKTET